MSEPLGRSSALALHALKAVASLGCFLLPHPIAQPFFSSHLAAIPATTLPGFKPNFSQLSRLHLSSAQHQTNAKMFIPRDLSFFSLCLCYTLKSTSYQRTPESHGDFSQQVANTPKSSSFGIFWH